jgi:hypothetical protein
MDLDGVREFKEKAQKIIDQELESLFRLELVNRMLGAAGEPWRCPPALGIHPTPEGNYQLAIRVRSRRDLPENAWVKLEQKARQANTKIDLRQIGVIQFLQGQPADKLRHKVRPLSIGVSIGQLPPSSSTINGTLGCFVRKHDNPKDIFILSNSHVIARPTPTIGQSITQPSYRYGGTEQDCVAKLDDFVRLNTGVSLNIDAAIAKVIIDVNNVDLTQVDGLGKLNGINTQIEELSITDPFYLDVCKLGCATGLQWGEISAFDIPARIHMEDGSPGFVFENQIEITPRNQSTFARHGDSGSIILDKNGNAIGLLFAVNEYGGAYANPIGLVLKNEKWDLELALT